MAVCSPCLDDSCASIIDIAPRPSFTVDLGGQQINWKREQAETEIEKVPVLVVATSEFYVRLITNVFE